ncbi:MAG TPA: hypothetical protein VGU01_14145 [Sphingomicrobium sp.]|nr:hypothetical protein [Sphingomicrobium sp.]
MKIDIVFESRTMDFISDDEVREFRESGQFDEQWYVDQYPDVKIVGVDPARHFLWIGAKLGRRPSRDANKSTVHFATSDGGAFEQPRRGGFRGALDRLQRALNYRAISKILTPELRLKIAESALFDEQYYQLHYHDRIEDRDDLVADYISCFARDPDRDPGPLFSTRFYSATHADVKDVHPFIHYVQYGMDEGRAAFSSEKVNAYISESLGIVLNDFSEIVPLCREVHIFCWEEGNFFFTDIAHYIGQLLSERGHRVAVRTDSPEPGNDDVLNMVVAPHEYCALGPGRHWTDGQYADAVYVNTEQWQTSWFALSLKYMRRSRVGVLDLNPSSAQGLARMGFKAGFLPLLPLPGSCFDFSQHRDLSEHVTRLKFVDPLTYPDRFENRTYDIVCCGVLNERRSKALAGTARILSEHRCFLHVPRFNRPIRPGHPDVLSAEDIAQLTRNTKIMLNIHQGDSHYLEWHRIFLIGMMQGAVVVSEPCYANSYVQPDVHYIESSVENMGSVLSTLLSTDTGRRKLAYIHENTIKLRDSIMNGERLIR